MKPILVSLLIGSLLWTSTFAGPVPDNTDKDTTDGPTNDFLKRHRSSAVPTGSVKIRSVENGKYLVGSSQYDSDRRNNALEDSPEEWTLIKDGSYYRITLTEGSEDLYAFDKAGYDADSGQRQVFTWIPGFGDSQGRWEIKEAPGYSGLYHIRNVHFNEYLYTPCCESNAQTRKVFEKPSGLSMYLWQITKY